jgi:chemotaxis protein MotB
MARKQKHEEHENHERWLVSYADFITLLFAFFVVMYSLSAVNEGKFRVLSEALVAAFNSTPKSLQPVQQGQPIKAPAPVTTVQPIKAPALVTPPELAPPPPAPVDSPRTQAIKEMADDIERAMGPLIKADLLVVRRDSLWIEVEIKTSILFPSGSARLQAQAIPILEKIAAILGRFPNAVHVEGFTDNVPINTLAFPSNWELSAARAASVVHLFMGSGIKPERMAAIGLGEYRPIADNASEEGRNKNRRVVLVVLADGDATDILQTSHAAVENINRAPGTQTPPVDTPAAAPAAAAPPAAPPKAALPAATPTLASPVKVKNIKRAPGTPRPPVDTPAAAPAVASTGVAPPSAPPAAALPAATHVLVPPIKIAPPLPNAGPSGQPAVRLNGMGGSP